jgi:hypothetical protein
MVVTFVEVTFGRLQEDFDAVSWPSRTCISNLKRGIKVPTIQEDRLADLSKYWRLFLSATQVPAGAGHVMFTTIHARADESQRCQGARTLDRCLRPYLVRTTSGLTPPSAAPRESCTRLRRPARA